jgi:hypothetical protein
VKPLTIKDQKTANLGIFLPPWRNWCPTPGLRRRL